MLSRFCFGESRAWHPYEGMTDLVVRLSSAVRERCVCCSEAVLIFLCLFQASASAGSSNVQLMFVRKFPTKGTFVDWAALIVGTPGKLGIYDPCGVAWHPDEGMANIGKMGLCFSVGYPLAWHPYEGMTIRSGILSIAFDRVRPCHPAQVMLWRMCSHYLLDLEEEWQRVVGDATPRRVRPLSGSRGLSRFARL